MVSGARYWLGIGRMEFQFLVTVDAAEAALAANASGSQRGAEPGPIEGIFAACMAGERGDL